MSDLSYIASILFTHVKITRQWKSTLSLICRTSSCPGRIRTKTCLGLKMYMTGFFCRFYFFNMSKIWIRNLSSSKIVQNLLQSFVFKTSEFEDCEQSLFRSKICEGSGICGYSRGEAREPRAASCAGALSCAAKLTSINRRRMIYNWDGGKKEDDWLSLSLYRGSPSYIVEP